jgi:hypothetical protein
MNKHTIMKSFLTFLVVALMWMFVAPDLLEARRGSRGGSRSFGGSRSKSTRTTQKSRTPAKKSTSATQQRNTGPKPSFGGSRLNSSKDYTQKYGAPRKAETKLIRMLRDRTKDM